MKTDKNKLERTKENEDFRNLPESGSKSKNIDKKAVKHASNLNKSGKTHNTDENK